MSVFTIEAIDIKPGMVYRLFESHDWATIKSLSYSFKRGAINGVKIEDVEGGGCSVGAYMDIQIKEVK
jgi:hypothetical protein